MSRGVPADWRAAPGHQRPETDWAADVHRACATGRTEGEGERLTGGSRQQCWAAVLLTSGALTGGTSLSAAVGGGEATTCTARAWAGPEKCGVG
jgi:hypothetical protein